MKKLAINCQSVPLFEGISEDELKSLLSCIGAYYKDFKKNEIIILEEDNVQYVGIVLSGSVNMIKEDIWGNQTLLTYNVAGETFGETFAVKKESASYVTFIAASDVLALFIPSHNIIHNCPHNCSFHGKLTQNMFDLLGNKNVNLIEKIEITQKTSIREKIMAYLSIQAQKQQSKYIDLPISKSALADYLGINRSAMSRELSKLREEKIIDFERGTFRIL